ncbi:uncharacterized protein BDR25DRAFT_363177 [Lindgomyces ingoldianus]|uniref:Uncharacterized protein n=1 Tax=Lindgomyces ingoldianus TaxID=673940 RepID=A0ACB6Q973_9PLEO|nr:uncharacterized protein BDR25DRAFT_363177 [Lindgomyces ingoldianus]KAF2463090.1 hypothetical protein BDR25DRAFT_363177 [Lindgomyces ingoldianus]
MNNNELVKDSSALQLQYFLISVCNRTVVNSGELPQRDIMKQLDSFASDQRGSSLPPSYSTYPAISPNSYVADCVSTVLKEKLHISLSMSRLVQGTNCFENRSVESRKWRDWLPELRVYLVSRVVSKILQLLLSVTESHNTDLLAKHIPILHYINLHSTSLQEVKPKAFQSP